MELPTLPFYRRWSVILAGVIGVATIVALIGWRGLAGVPETTTTVTTVPSTTQPPPSTTEPPSSSDPTSKPNEVLWEASERSPTNSQGFQATTGWRLEWSFDCGNFKDHGGGNFKITGDGAFQQIQIERTDVRGGDTRTYRNGGFGHLVVESVCERWTVRALSG
jgi:hypothetical protein